MRRRPIGTERGRSDRLAATGLADLYPASGIERRFIFDAGKDNVRVGPLKRFIVKDIALDPLFITRRIGGMGDHPKIVFSRNGIALRHFRCGAGGVFMTARPIFFLKRARGPCWKCNRPPTKARKEAVVAARSPEIAFISYRGIDYDNTYKEQ